MMCDASMHRGESLPHGVPATLFSRPADFHASPSFALRTLSFSPSALSPFALSVAERSRRVIFQAPPFDCGPTGLRSGRTAGPKLNLTPALRSLSVRPERSGAKSKALEAHPSTAALRAYAQGERRGGGEGYGRSLGDEKRARPCGRALHWDHRDSCRFAQPFVFPIYCTVSVTSSSVKSVLPDDDVSLPVNLITTVWPMYGARLAVCTV
jgi:hypothetical protein